MAAVNLAAGVMAMLAAAPGRLGGGGGLDLSLGRILSVLIICLLLAGTAALLLKRGGGRIDWTVLREWKGAPARRIEVIETRRISANADICLFRCDDEDFLILSSATAQQVLRRVPARERSS